MEKTEYLFNAAGNALRVAGELEESADKAIKNIKSAADKLEYTAKQVKEQIGEEIRTSLNSSVTNAVDELVKKFQDADKYADQAARRYEKAVRDADWRTVTIVSLSFIVGLVVGLVVGKYFLW